MFRKLKWIDGLLVLGVVLMAVGIGMGIEQSGNNQPKVEIIKGDVKVNSKVMIDMGGAVVKPGIYQLTAGSRVNEVLIAAGGLAAEADRDWVAKNLNLARMVTDGEKIFIPEKNSKVLGSQTLLQAQDDVAKAQDDIININTASAEELDKLPGIGPAMAGRIIDYRQTNGGFRNVEEIKLVKGIGEKMYVGLKDKIAI